MATEPYDPAVLAAVNVLLAAVKQINDTRFRLNEYEAVCRLVEGRTRLEHAISHLIARCRPTS